MRIWSGIRWVSMIRKHPPSFQTPHLITESSQIFDPDFWQSSEPSTSSSSISLSHSPVIDASISSETSNFDVTSVEEENSENPGTPAGKKKKSEIVEENRTDGHAPIKSALSNLMQSLQQSSGMKYSLSDIDVTLFNFHSTKFAERLLNKNVSSIVIVESSHVFSKNAKKFAEKLPNVAAYRADIYTLMGVGRKKTTKFPDRLMLAEAKNGHTETKVPPLTLTSSSKTESSHDEYHRLMKIKRPHLVAVLPTPNIQKTVLDSMIQHALLHHSGIDTETIFKYGETNLMTFLGSGILSQYTCSTDDRLSFLSHQHRRHSALFNKLFEIKELRKKQSGDPANPSEIPFGFDPSSFHPQLPTAKKLTHEKKLADVSLENGLQYSVQISPRRHVAIGGKEVTTENGLGKELVDYACFMTQIGRQPNAKSVEQVVRSLWPESSIPSDLLGEFKVGQISLDHLEGIFHHIREELHSTQIARSYCNELKIKRAVVEN